AWALLACFSPPPSSSGCRRAACSADRRFRLHRMPIRQKPIARCSVDEARHEARRAQDMTGKGDNSKKALVTALNGALADHLALYVKTKNFHWHVAGPRFHDLHLLFDAQAGQIVGVTDAIGERVRKNDAPTLTSI